MSPENARAARRARLARLLKDEPHLTRKELAQRLGLKKDTLRRDLAAIEEARAQKAQAARAESADDTPAPGPALPAPQASEPSAPGARPVRTGAAPHTGEEAQRAQPVRLPRRGPGARVEMDLRAWPAMRRDLAVLAQTGRTPEELISQAVVVLAYGYRQALARGDLAPGQPFVVTDLTLRPPALLADRPAS
ncbi:DeoR family transcriptional regulator [Streptomyces griseoincarnatus]